MRRDQATLRRRVMIALGAIVVGGAADLVTDRPAHWFSVHIIFELLLLVGAVTLILLLAVNWLRERRAADELRDALRDLGAAIDRQLVEWRLTPSEREVALMLLKGYSHKRIARETDRSERTVRQHAAMAYQKAGLSSRAELAAYFLEGLIVPKGDEE